MAGFYDVKGNKLGGTKPKSGFYDVNGNKLGTDNSIPKLRKSMLDIAKDSVKSFVEETRTKEKGTPNTNGSTTTPVATNKDTTSVVDTNKGTTDNTTYKGESVLKDTPRKATPYGIKPVSQLKTIESNTKNYVDKENERATINFYEDVSRQLENSEEGFDLTYAINYADGLPKEMRYAMRNILEDRLEDKKAQMDKKYKSYGDSFLDTLKVWEWTSDRHPMPTEYISERNSKSYEKDAQELANLQSAINTFDKYGDAIDLSYDELKAKRDSLDKNNSKENEERLYYQNLMNRKHYESVAKEMSTIMVEIDGKEMSVLEAMQKSAEAKDDATKKKIAEICKPIFSERGYLDDDFASDIEKTQNRLKGVFERGASLRPRYSTIPTVTKKRADFVVGKPVGGYEVYYSILTGDDSLAQWDESLKSLVQSAKKGIAGWSYGIGSTFDNLLGAFGWDKNPFHYASEYDKTAVQNAEHNKNYYADRAGNPDWLKYANDVTEGVTGALPDMILTYMTAGAFKGGTTTKALQSASASANATSTLAKIGLTASNMAKNPNFWTSFARTVGTSYEHAKETGASDTEAWYCALLESLINAGIEVGIDGNSGYQGLIKDVAEGNKTTLRKWVASALTEGGEEGLQGIVSRAIQKYGLGENVKVLDEIQIAYEMAMGTAVGGIMGAPTLVASALSPSPDAQLGKKIRTTFKDATGEDLTNKFIEDCIKIYPKNSEAYKLAQEAKERIDSGKKVSNDMLGKIYRASVEQNDKKAETKTDDTTNAKTEDVTSESTPETPPVTEATTTAQSGTTQTASTPVQPTQNAQTPVTQTPVTPTKSTTNASTKITDAVYITTDEKGNNVAYGENAEFLAGQLDLPIHATTINGETVSMVRWNDSIVSDDFATYDVIVSDTPQINMARHTVTPDVVPTTPHTNVKTPVVDTTTPVETQKGVTHAYTNKNQKIDLKYKVVSVDDLITSNNADGTINQNYPQELQPRDRTRSASIIQVQNIANNVVPEKLGESANVSDGAPIVGSDNVVESGNGRTMALSLMYKNNPEGAKQYKDYLIANADKFGIDVNNLPNNPVLVRERLTDVDRAEFVKEANESTLSTMGAVEQAKTDSERLTNDILSLLVPNDDGNLNTQDNRAFVSRVIHDVFPQNDLNSVVGAGGMLSANGLERVRNAVFFKAYGDVELASRLAESLDNDIKNITNVLVNIAPKIVAVKNGIANGKLYNIDFSQDIVDAINFLQNAKKAGLSVENFANQLTIDDSTSDVAKAFAYFFEQKNRGAKQATLYFNHLCDTILEKDPNQISFLGETKVPTKEDLLYEAIERYNNDEQRTGEAVHISERIIPQRSEESARANDLGRISDNLESSTEQTTDDSESNGVTEQHGYVEEETVVRRNESTSQPSDNRTADSRAENITNEAEVGAGELSYNDFTLDKTKHTQTGKERWVIRPKERVENFKELQSKMKSLGGYYSRFVETPQGKGGFVFKTDPSLLFKKTQDVAESKPKTQSVEETPTGTAKNDGTKQIADYVADKLSKGEKITAIELSAISTKAFGGTMADNVYSIKDAYDAMELGVNKYILSMKDISSQKMLELLDLLPTQTKRTESQIKFQQFSTPPSIAYLANYVANVNSNDIMLEPSAGIGGIAVFAKRDGATVYVNELDNRRLDVLKNMPFDKFFNENAEQLDNILGGKIEPTVIVMNPPFSSSSERNIQNTKIGAKHIEEALKILAPNGRLVAIVGKGMSDNAPAFRDWWKDIKSKYNVRANIGINGKNYNKYGTNFDIQMLVIDKNGATTHTETGYVDTLQELQEKLESIREERPNVEPNRRIETNKGTEQKSSELTRKETSRKGKTSDVGIKSVSGTDSLADNGKSTDTTGTTRKSDVEVLQTTDADGRRTDNKAPENTDVVDDEQRLHGRGEFGGHTELRDDGRVDISDSGQHSEQSAVDRSNRNVGTRQNNVGVQRRKRTELTDSIFEQYQTQPLKFKNTKAHPGKVSESSAMSAITPPTVTYKPHLSEDIVANGVVSDVQLEAISYAGQSHSQVLANGTTRGFFLGDGTGIGKGRTIAGMILDNYNQGRKKAVWITENESLMLDAKRDLTALFGNSDLLMQFEGGKKADKIFGKDEAILAVSYSTLSRGYDKKGSNYEKIIDWLGKDFDGILVFDEAHNMSNATGKKGKRGNTKPSQTGLAGIALQEALPKARVVYSSATGATEVENLRYAERLGLWGEGTAFINGDDFVSKIKAGGLASMELIARDMKAMGVYLSRNISYDDVQYEKITHELTPQQTKIYDELAHSWQIVLQNINKALEITNQDKDGHARGRALGAFWNAHQRFFNQILTSMQVPSVISDIEKQLADGKSCVIQLVSTNESAQNREMERIKSEDLDLDEFDLTPKQMLMSMIEHSFPVQQYEEYRDDEGNRKSKLVYDSAGNPVLNREAVKQRDELLEKLGSIKVPSSPIDMIINHFGTDLVAEKTGRSRRVIQKDGKTIEENIANKKDADVDAFQNGNKRIMIFSKAGGTGKSYHADKSAKNQQQRVHYLLEAGWQADKAVQGFGRSHRSNQASAPIFKLVTTNLKGQMRFISTIAKRLDQLGAMTKGQRQAGGQGMFSASDNLENSFASDVLAVFYKDLLANKVDGVDNGLDIIEKLGLKDKILDEYNVIRVTAEELRDVSKFLNRILSLESSEQNTVFDGYAQRLQEATEKAMADGTLEKGLENYKADKITLNEVKDIREDERSGAKTKYYNLTAEHKIKPVKFDDIQTNHKSFVGFYRNKNTGVVRAVMRTSSTTDQYGNVTDNYKLVGQAKNEYIPQHRLYGNWVEVKTEEARKLWNEELTKLPEYRKENLHLISGVVLPVWDKLPTENVRIYRVLTSDGEMLIGRVVSEDMIDETLRKLGSSRKKEKIATNDLIEGIKNGDTVHLENGWKIVQRKVSNENRIEIVGVSYEHADLVKKKGVFTERIQYNTRYFVPSDTNTEKIIDDILKLSPVMRVENTKYSMSVSEDYSNEQKGNLLPNGNREWPYSTSTRKQTKGMDGRSRRYKEGRTTAFERRKYCQTLKASGNTRQEVISGHKCEVIPEEHYTPLMTEIAKQNKKDGIDETIFITGKATIPSIKDGEGKPKLARGVYIKDNGKKTVIVQYDNEFYSPKQINDHEKIHDRYDTPLVQKAKNVIMNNLSVADREHILEKLSRDYNGIIEGNEEAIIEEFVANVLTEMDYEYIGYFSDVVKAYWKGDETYLDNFKVSEYTEVIDAGGTNTNVLDNIGFGNDNELNSSNQLYLSAEEYAVVSKAIMSKNAGLSDNELKPFDYAYSAKYLYVYKNHSLGNFTVVDRFDLVTDKDVLSYVKEAINNGTFRNGQGFNKWSGGIQSKRGRDNSYPKRIENTGTARTDDRLPFVSRGGNDVGYSIGDGIYPTGNYVKYSYDSAESDIEELTPERKKEIFEQFEKDRAGVDKPTQKQLWGERGAWILHNMTRVFPNIPERGAKGTFFAEFRKSMIQWTKLPQTASFMVQDKLNKMTKDLTPKEYKTFAELVYFLDLQEEAEIQKERGYAEILLPNEITPTEVDAIVKVLNEEATENVKQALIKRQDIWNALKTQYVELNNYIGFDTDGKFKRKNYYHHQVIEYMNNGGKGTGSREIGIKAGRGWLKERQGSTKAINTDFLAVEYQAMLQMQYDVYIAETLGKIKEQYDIKPQLETEARNYNKNALKEIIRNEATDKDGNVMLDSKGKPDSETYRQQMWYNSRIMMGFDGLFDLAERNELPTYDGEYSNVVNALRMGNLNANGLYKYVGILANTNLPDNATDAQEQAVINARTILKYTSQKRAWIKDVLGDNFQTWETLAKSMSDTHTIHQPRRGNYFYIKNIIDEDAFNQAYQEMVLSLAKGDMNFGNEDIKKLFEQYADTVRLMGVAYEQWVLPKEIVTTMNEIANPKQVNVVAKLARKIINTWKGWSTSVNPLRTIKFGIRNFFGDLDAVIAGKPQVAKYAKKAVEDIYQAMRHKNYSSDFMEWVERGGYTSMIFANEMDTETQNKLFSHLNEKSGINIFKIPSNILKGYANGVETIHNFREAILRYSSYLYFKEEIKRNGGVVKDNVASNRYIVAGLDTIEDKAYQLAKDLLGAYDEVGKMGQFLRRYLIPFYSFAETNMKRYYRMFENIIMSDDKIPKKAGKLLLKALMVNMLYLLMTAWNRLVMDEEDDKLPPATRNIPHITFGQIGDDIYAFRQLGSFSELLEWVGLDDYEWTEEDLMAPVDKAWGMVTPFIKLPLELATGLNYYPSLSQPRSIRDKWEHFFNSWGVSDVYNEVTGKPTRGWADTLKGAFVYNYDYKESAYSEIIDIKRKYQDKTDNTIYGVDEKSNALYYMKTAIKYKDKESAYKYLDEYFENGGTARGIKQSLSALNPMHGYTSKDTMKKGEEFIASLTDEEKEKLKIAQEYYENDLMLPENVLSKLGKKNITDEQAKNLLRNYINSKCK